MTIADWLEFAVVLLPLVLLMGISTVPLALGVVVTVRHRRRNDGPAYLQVLAGSTAAGVVALGLLAGALFGTALASSSTSALIFVVTPVWSALAYGVVYGLAKWRLRGQTHGTLSAAARHAFVVPVILLVALAGGIVRYAVGHSDIAVAERARRPALLSRVYTRTSGDEAARRRVVVFLADNRHTPSEILVDLQADASAVIRAKVAANPNTPAAVVEALSRDTSDRVRAAARRRLERFP